eukprot:gene36372-41156_t
MSREQRRPLVAFCAVAMVCAVIMVSALRSDAVRGFLTTGIESVQAFGAHNGATYILQVDPTYRRIALTSSDSLV